MASLLVVIAGLVLAIHSVAELQTLPFRNDARIKSGHDDIEAMAPMIDHQ